MALSWHIDGTFERDDTTGGVVVAGDEVRERGGDRGVAIGGGVLVDERGAGAGVAHACHQLAGARAGGGGEGRTNTVQVDIPEGSDTATYQSAFASAYGTESFEYVQSTAGGTATDRYSDVPPWNGGDQILKPVGSNNYTVCTSGFGAHDTPGNTYMLTAGHCTSGGTGSNYKWFNTHTYAPQYTPDRFMGEPDAQAFTYGYDVERLPTSSSNLFWKESATREYVADDAAPAVGDNVCLEGSQGLERCSTIGAVDKCLYFPELGVTLNGLFYTPNAASIKGNSGGPVVWPTDYGYMAVGTITGNNGSTGVSTSIIDDEFFMGARVNSLVAP